MYLRKIGEIEQKLKEEMQKYTATQIHGIFAAARGLKLKKVAPELGEGPEFISWKKFRVIHD